MKASTIPQTQAFPGTLLGSLWNRLRAVWQGITLQRCPRRLRLSETVSLGEKRLIAVVEFEGQRFLLAATSENISLLQSLGPAGAQEIPRAEGA